MEKIIPPDKEESFNPINLLNKKKKEIKKNSQRLFIELIM
tara:strand:- start:449 stop:568 length:120 start_codon:yes stop_codon:yes gene_type:complete